MIRTQAPYGSFTRAMVTSASPPSTPVTPILLALLLAWAAVAGLGCVPRVRRQDVQAVQVSPRPDTAPVEHRPSEEPQISEIRPAERPLFAPLGSATPSGFLWKVEQPSLPGMVYVLGHFPVRTGEGAPLRRNALEALRASETVATDSEFEGQLDSLAFDRVSTGELASLRDSISSEVFSRYASAIEAVRIPRSLYLQVGSAQGVDLLDYAVQHAAHLDAYWAVYSTLTFARRDLSRPRTLLVLDHPSLRSAANTQAIEARVRFSVALSSVSTVSRLSKHYVQGDERGFSKFLQDVLQSQAITETPFADLIARTLGLLEKPGTSFVVIRADRMLGETGVLAGLMRAGAVAVPQVSDDKASEDMVRLADPFAGLFQSWHDRFVVDMGGRPEIKAANRAVVSVPMRFYEVRQGKSELKIVVAEVKAGLEGRTVTANSSRPLNQPPLRLPLTPVTTEESYSPNTGAKRITLACEGRLPGRLYSLSATAREPTAADVRALRRRFATMVRTFAVYADSPPEP